MLVLWLDLLCPKDVLHLKNIWIIANACKTKKKYQSDSLRVSEIHMFKYKIVGGKRVIFPNRPNV